MAKINTKTGEILDYNIPTFKKQLSQQQYKTIVSQTPSKTHQSHADSCDINSVIKTYARTGVLPPNTRGTQPQYLDVSDLNRPYSDILEEVRDTKDVIDSVNQKIDQANKAKEKTEKEEFEKFRTEKQKPKPATDETTP